MAVTELGLSPKEFWALTWYEWGLYVIRNYKQHKRRQEDHELFLGVTRIMIADFKNVHRDPRKSRHILPQDIFKLSYDTQIDRSEIPDFNRIARRLGSTIKKKGSGDK